jgi:hypothetical protein
VPIVKVNSLDRVRKVLIKVSVPAVWISIILFSCGIAAAQVAPASHPSPTPPPGPIDGKIKGPDDPPLTTFEEEMRAKRAIKIAEKDHEENLKRAREIAELGKEIGDSLKDKSVIDHDSLKKVERLEKLTKKVRGEAGGEDEDVEIPNRPADLPATLAKIAEASESLSKKVIDTPRQVVSASVIDKANVLLELIKMARNFARP